MKVLALDIGGTNIRAGIVKRDRVFEWKKVKTPKQRNAILREILNVVKNYDVKNLDAVCVSVAGFERDGKLVHAINLAINGVELRKILRKEFRKRIFIENDANCAGLAELHYGVGKGKRNFVLLTLGTGIGGAVVIDKKLYRGNGGAAEIGSMWIDGDIFEHWASGDASVNIARKMFNMHGITSLELEERANKGEHKALRVYNLVGHYLGVGLANLAYLLDPDVLILGGGFTRVKHIHKPAKEAFEKHYTINPKPKIVKARFGDDAGLIGAGILANRNG